MSVGLIKSNRWMVSTIICCVLVVAILLSAGVALANGQANITLGEVYQILFYKISHGLVGDLSVVQNPLADPYILGISSGASLGATFAILVGFGGSALVLQLGLSFGAFAGAGIATILVLLLASIGGKMTSTKLVLSGTIVSALCSSVSNLIIYLASNAEGMKTVAFWSMGSLASASWNKLGFIVVLVSLITLFFLTQYRVLNTLLLGDEVASTLGVKLTFYRRFYMLLAALLTRSLQR